MNERDYLRIRELQQEVDRMRRQLAEVIDYCESCGRADISERISVVLARDAREPERKILVGNSGTLYEMVGDGANEN